MITNAGAMTVLLPLDHAEMLQLIGSERSYNKDSLSRFSEFHAKAIFR